MVALGATVDGDRFGAAVAAAALGVFVACGLGVAVVVAAAELFVTAGAAVTVVVEAVAFAGADGVVVVVVGVAAAVVEVAADFAAVLEAPPSLKLVVLWQVPQSAVVLG